MENTVKPINELFSRKPRRDMLALSPTTNKILNVLMVICCLLALLPIYVIVISSVTSAIWLSRLGVKTPFSLVSSTIPRAMMS